LDVDGRRPLRIASGDVFLVSGRTKELIASFLAQDLQLRQHAPNQAEFIGDPMFTIQNPNGETRWMTEARKVAIEVDLQAAASARLATCTFHDANDRPVMSFSCTFESPFYRTLTCVESHTDDVEPFQRYDIRADSELQQNRFSRELTLKEAFEESGVELVTSLRSVGRPPPPADDEWDDAELYAAMPAELRAASPGWNVWKFETTQSNKKTVDQKYYLLGTMFDIADSAQRQGCAVFNRTIAEKAGGESQIVRRLGLFCGMHELGHCLNLTHPFGTTAQTMLSAVLSWMNYPWNYGEFERPRPDFFPNFPFCFDNSKRKELVHLRHSPLADIIPGGAPFKGSQAALASHASERFLINESGLNLELRATRPSFALSEPVVVEVNLHLADRNGQPQSVHPQLHPRLGLVRLSIQKPDGEIEDYEPIASYCFEPTQVLLDHENPALYESAYVGYGRRGFYFDREGIYRLCAEYTATDGSIIVSNTLNVRIRPPASIDDEYIADQYFTSDSGVLFCLVGSDAQSLRNGMNAFQEVSERYPLHPLTIYSRFVSGVNLARNFKSVGDDGKIAVRQADLGTAEKELAIVKAQSETTAGLDNITLNLVARCLANVQQRQQQDQKAAETLRTLVDFYEKKKRLSPHVVARIRKDVEIASAEGRAIRY
jgi:hypothetical protein